MARYRCGLCGEIYDEEKEGVRFEDLPDDWTCPACGAPKSCFEKIDDEPVPEGPSAAPQGTSDDIRYMAENGRGPGDAMETPFPVPGFDGILIMGCQLDPQPLQSGDPVSLTTVIGRNCPRPMVLDTPVFISHMSYGALSSAAKVALQKGAQMADTATCSGEGGVLRAEAEAQYRYIYEYPPNGYSLSGETMGLSSAVEIKIGQGTKPGMGGHLPGAKVTPEIAAIRGMPEGRDIHSPSRFPGAETPGGLRDIVGMLREMGGGIPVGVKIAAGRIESDLAFIARSGCDFITIDGRGGATGSSPKVLRDHSSVPTVYALARARRYMDAHGMEQDLIITGGFRSSQDVFKALSMGADAVAMASAPLIALGCERYRICGSGRCPKGIATQDPALQARLDTEAGQVRVGNYLNALSEDLRMFCRVTGHADIGDVSPRDLAAQDRMTAEATGIRGQWEPLRTPVGPHPVPSTYRERPPVRPIGRHDRMRQAARVRPGTMGKCPALAVQSQRAERGDTVHTPVPQGPGRDTCAPALHQ